MSLLFDCQLLLLLGLLGCLAFSLVVWSSCGPGRVVRGPAVRCRSCLCALPQLSCHSPIRVSALPGGGTPLQLTYFHLCSPNPPVHPSQPNPGLQRDLPDQARPTPRPHGTDRPALSSPCAPRYGLRLPGCNLVTARPAGWKVGLGSGSSSAGCLWKPQGR